MTSTPAAESSLGPFIIEGMLGEGALGVVYRARRADGEVVALKVLRTELADSETHQRRFLREARVAERLRHPHLVPVLEVGEANGRRYLAVGYVDGGTLAERIASHGQLPLAEVVDLTAQIAAGLAAVHRAGLVHRDIKPSNVMIDGTGRALLTDFGLARGEGLTVLTAQGVIVGTPHYLAPELIEGGGGTPASDVYALGCLVYECVCGRAPFAGRPLFEVAFGHLEEEAERPESLRTDVAPVFGAAVMTALDKRPEQRPSTAVAYASLLLAALR